MVRLVSLHPQTGGMFEPEALALPALMTRSEARLETRVHCISMGALHKGSSRY
jgi:predicted RNA polymerase sigma factor